MSWQDVHLFVCHTLVLSVKTYQTGWQYSDGGTPLTGASNARWYEKNHDFRPISRFISQMMQDRAIYYGRRIRNRTQPFEWYRYHLTSNNSKTVPDQTELYLQWRTNRNSYNMVYLTAPFSMTLNKPLTQFSRSRYTLTLNIS